MIRDEYVKRKLADPATEEDERFMLSCLQAIRERPSQPRLSLGWVLFLTIYMPSMFYLGWLAYAYFTLGAKHG